MRRKKIIGVTVGSPLPKPNLKQTDPKRGDFVHGRDIIPTKVSQLDNDAKYVTEEQLGSLSAEKLNKDDVFSWAKAEQFDVANLANCNLTAREGYARYKDNAARFVYTMPNPQPGEVTVTLRFERDENHAGKGTGFFFVYSDGTRTQFKDITPDTVQTFVSDAGKTVVEFTGGHSHEQYVYLDLSVMSMIADYAAPTGGGVTDEQIRDAVEDYLTENPPEVDMNGYIQAPETAKIGQTIRVSAVDADGKPTEWEAVDMGSGETADEYVVLFNKKFEAAVANTDEWGGESDVYERRHFWTTDVNGNEVDLDGVYLSIYVPSQTEVTSGELRTFVGQGAITWWGSWSDNESQPYIGRSSFVASGKQRWAYLEYDLREKTFRGAVVDNQYMNGNYQGANVVQAISFPQAVAQNNWTKWKGIEVELISGGLPAGTEIFIYGRKCNPNKVAIVPAWEVGT